MDCGIKGSRDWDNVKKIALTVLYFPLQLVIVCLLSPIILAIIACMRADQCAFDDVYIVEDNKMLNQNGPSMTRKKSHWWITRFIGIDVLIDAVKGAN